MTGWRQLYEKLTRFIAEHPEVEINETFVSIPRNVRSEFYRLFDKVRMAFLEERFPDLLDEARLLSDSYVKVEHEVVRVLKLDKISMSTKLHMFLHDPKNALMRELFDPLFHLLRGKIDVKTFEEEQSKNIENSFRNLYSTGYEKWVALSLVKLLEADRNFSISASFPSSRGIIHALGSKHPVPRPQGSKVLSLEHEIPQAFIVPNFIVHSAKVGRYVAIGLEIGIAMWTASKVSKRREWYPLKSIREKYSLVDLKPDMIICVDERPEDVALIADSERICRPDLIIECMEQKDWYEKGDLEKAKLHHNVLKPRLGTFIVSRKPVPEQVHEKLGDGIRLLTVGFDQSKLAPIINTLTCHGE